MGPDVSLASSHASCPHRQPPLLFGSTPTLPPRRVQSAIHAGARAGARSTVRSLSWRMCSALTGDMAPPATLVGEERLWRSPFVLASPSPVTLEVQQGGGGATGDYAVTLPGGCLRCVCACVRK
jgi:hypothetical protein